MIQNHLQSMMVRKPTWLAPFPKLIGKLSNLLCLSWNHKLCEPKSGRFGIPNTRNLLILPPLFNYYWREQTYL